MPSYLYLSRSRSNRLFTVPNLSVRSAGSTLGARDFSWAVSGFGRVFVEDVSADTKERFPSHASETKPAGTHIAVAGFEHLPLLRSTILVSNVSRLGWGCVSNLFKALDYISMTLRENRGLNSDFKSSQLFSQLVPKPFSRSL